MPVRRFAAARAWRAPFLLVAVLVLVLAALGLLVVALAGGGTGWAWGSAGTSGLAGALLAGEWFARRR